MFDSIYLKVKCPVCGEEKERECQTKDLDCDLYRWAKYDNTGHPEFQSVECIVGCDSHQCGKPTYLITGSLSIERQESYFYIEVATPFGLITGNYKYLYISNLLNE